LSNTWERPDGLIAFCVLGKGGGANKKKQNQPNPPPGEGMLLLFYIWVQWHLFKHANIMKKGFCGLGRNLVWQFAQSENQVLKKDRVQ
jgi:hypothetical protein